MSAIPELDLIDRFLSGEVFREMPEVEPPIVMSHFDYFKEGGTDE